MPKQASKEAFYYSFFLWPFAEDRRLTFLWVFFKFQVWDSYFYLSVLFINQPCLQLESFSPSKRKKTLEK